MYKLDAQGAVAALYGGLFLGGGGGGSLKNGLASMNAALALGEIRVLDLDEFPKDGTVVTVSVVGSPASKEGFLSTDQILRGFELFQKAFESPVSGIITNENGGHSSSNGWILAASAGLPIIDAPCNGRAHPTGVMGSMGLDLAAGYRSLQSAAGGKRDLALELTVSGKIGCCAAIVRQAAVQAGGLVVVYRNPVKASYLKENAAPGALAQAVRIGRIFQDGTCREDILAGLENMLDAEILASGTAVEFELSIEGGFDHGSVTVENPSGLYRAGFWNEFMVVDGPKGRLATFPDLIACLDAETGQVVTSAELAKGRKIDILKVPADMLILGAGMKNVSQFRLVGKVLGTDILSFAFPGGEV